VLARPGVLRRPRVHRGVRPDAPSRSGTGRQRRAPAKLAAAIALAALALTVAGCDHHAAAEPGWPLGVAGRACQLLDYDVVADALGTRFDTVGGATVNGTFTCAMTQAEHAFPDLTLSVTGSAADEVIFTATMVPSGSQVVKGLGLAAYQAEVDPAGTGGPGVEVGWLSAKARLMALRYTFPVGTAAAQVDDMGAHLVTLARHIEQTPL
jgi:hypothetical protein